MKGRNGQGYKKRKEYRVQKVNGVPHWQEICKYTLKAQGLDFAGLPRKPLGELDDANKKKIDKLLADMK